MHPASAVDASDAVSRTLEPREKRIAKTSVGAF